MEAFFFGFFAIASVAAALSLILQKNPLYSALSLIIVIASMGGLFLLLNATFIAVLQIIIYAGAVMALFLFVIMMVDVKEDQGASRQGLSRIVMAVLLFIAGGTIWGISLALPEFRPLTADFSVHGISSTLFTSYLFPFEAIGLLIVSAVIGALYIARKEDA